MRTVMVHGVLLAAALVAAWVTWTSNAPLDTGAATIAVWDDDPRSITSIRVESGESTLRIERRTAERQSYLWAQETTRPAPPPPEPDTAEAEAAVAAVDTGAAAMPSDDAADAGETDAGDAVAASDTMPPEEPERVVEFPVGDQGDSLLIGLAQLRAVRDLGDADDDTRAAYGLADSSTTVTVRLRDGGERTLALGSTAIGGSDRYVLDVEHNRIFAVPVTVVRPLETSQMLRLTEYQTFEPDDVARVTVSARGSERTMERRSAGAAAPATWSPPNGEQQDPAFAGFMDQVERLWVSEFAPDASADTLDVMLRVDYYDRRGNAIGYLELYRAPDGAESADASRYFMRSPRTIVPGEVYAPLGERLEQDIETMFGGNAPAAASAGDTVTRSVNAGP